MKRSVLLFFALLLASCATRPDRFYLTDWTLNPQEENLPASVPGFVHTDLMTNGHIPDPFYGTNEDSVQWVDKQEWVYATCVSRRYLPEGDSLWIVFEGLAGRALISLGRNTPIFVDNMFVTYSLPLPEFEDSLDIWIHLSPLNDADQEVAYGIPLPDRRAFTRIAPYQQGWDWGPKLTTCGIWKPVYITNKPSRTSKTSKTSKATIELRQEQDSIGQSFTFYRDGKPLFIKGANWIPVHSFPILDSANKARYRYLLCSAKEAGFNMLRVWGGGIYEHDYFYDLCDSLGLMVWQDFIFAGTPYPDNADMLGSIDREVRHQVCRLSKHPCIVLWCGNNEVKNGWEDWGWQGQYNWTPEQRARLEKAMDTIFGYSSTSSNTSTTSILAQAVRDCDPMHRPYITTSPLYGWGHPECVTHGDSHYWGIWWGEEPFERYAEKTGRFMSEYGFQSYPMISTIKQFCPRDELYIDSPTLRSHQKHGRGREIIDKAMRQYYGFDSKTLNLEDYCYVSQLLQAWGVGYGIFQHIKQQPHCMGTLYWQLNDCWPVASWSSIDYYGNWKALHYCAQALYSIDDDMEMRGEKINRWEKYYSVYPKDRSYPKPQFTLTSKTDGGKLTVTITAQSDLYDVYLDTEPHVDGHFTSNFFDIKAGKSVNTTLIPANPKAKINHVKVTIRTLNELMNR